MNRYLNSIDSTEAHTIVRFLCTQTKVNLPTLKISRRKGNRGEYHWMRQWIHLSKSSQLWVVVHEFAHHLDRNKNGIRQHMKRGYHAEGFYFKLRRCIELIGDPHLYPWNLEYASIQKMARRDGLLCDTKL